MEQVTILRGKDAFIKGSGYGSGDGYGYGYGSGDGSGDGYGDGSYWQACLAYFSAKWGREQRERLTALKKAGAKICYWRSTQDAKPANGGSGAPVKAGDVQKIAGPLEVCTKRALHGTMIPPKWKGERWWVVALIGEIQGDDEKYGALEREIIGECV